MCSEEITRCSAKGDLTLDMMVGGGLAGHVTQDYMKIEMLAYAKSAELF